MRTVVLMLAVCVVLAVAPCQPVLSQDVVRTERGEVQIERQYFDAAKKKLKLYREFVVLKDLDKDGEVVRSRTVLNGWNISLRESGELTTIPTNPVTGDVLRAAEGVLKSAEFNVDGVPQYRATYFPSGAERLKQEWDPNGSTDCVYITTTEKFEDGKSGCHGFKRRSREIRHLKTGACQHFDDTRWLTAGSVETRAVGNGSPVASYHRIELTLDRTARVFKTVDGRWYKAAEGPYSVVEMESFLKVPVGDWNNSLGVKLDKDGQWLTWDSKERLIADEEWSRGILKSASKFEYK